MEQIELKDFVPLLTGVVTACAALLGVAITNYFSLRNARASMREQRQLRLDERRMERMEELFTAFERWEMNFSQIYLFNLRRHRGLLTSEQVFEMVAKLEVLEKGDVQRLSMLLYLYFPALSTPYTAVQDARKAIVPFLSDRAQANPESFVVAQELFEACCEGFKQAISTLPRLFAKAA